MLSALFLPLLAAQLVAGAAASVPGWTEDGLHLPLYRKETRRLRKRDAGTAAIGLGDVLDVTYNVLVEVGGVSTPLVLDSGSADLWVISDACTGNCTVGVPLYPQETFQQTGMDVHLLYGDSFTGTHAFGPIGKDKAGIATIGVQDQYFAAITDTNTTVLETGSAGILGIGFPPISVLWRQLLSAELNNTPPSAKAHAKRINENGLGTFAFPTFDFVHSPSFESHGTYKRQAKSPNSTLTSSAQVIESFATYGPLLTRFISQKLLVRPLVAASLQRDTVDIGGNVGMLSIGALPKGISEESLTWVPLRAYTVADGGLPPPPDTPNEVYPLVWEIPVDDVFFNDVRLDRSKLAPPNISLSALVDTGNSLIRGPQDVIDQIHTLIGGSTFDCAKPQNLSFQIGGKMFSVDPRDFVHQTFTDSVDFCEPALAATDPPAPGAGFLYAWSLGDPFLKSVLTAFYYGNLTRPSQDPPRIGLLSTLSSDAGDRLQAVVAEAKAGNDNLILTSEAAPSGTFIATVTGVGGVPQATHVQPDQAPGSPDSSFAHQSTSSWNFLVVASATSSLCLLLGFLLAL